MKKYNNNRSNNNSQSTTKVICSNCGAEIVIPDHQHKVSGTAIGKDSGLGTVELQTVQSSYKSDMPDAIIGMAAVFGVPVNSDKSTVDALAELIRKIQDEGYIETPNVVRRWVPSQCVTMLESNSGFHQTLKAMGTGYSWSVLESDLKCQMKLFNSKDFDGYKDRNRWYNRKVSLEMAEDYLAKLRKEVDRMPVRMHKGRPYVKLNCWLNRGKGVHINELQESLYGPIEGVIAKIKKSTHPSVLYSAVSEFSGICRSIRLEVEPSAAFMNAYKAAGGYYTMKDFILFEGFNLKVDQYGDTDFTYDPARRHFAEQEESLKALERKATEVVSRGVCAYGYELLGLLKEFLDYNHFDYKQTTEKWAHQSEARRLMRALSGNRRPRK